MRAQTSGRRLHNVPAELTSFVGRRRELAEIKERLETSRLVTLTGSGGVGKTRLALRAANQLVRAFPDGVWLVALAPVNDPQLVTQAAFSALGLEDFSPGWALATLTDHLADRHLLLILDNCEHVLDSSAVLATTILKACPEVRILATSRHPLGVPGEARFRVPSLSMPDAGATDLPPERLVDFEAVTLLVERAAGAVPSFRLDQTNANQVLQLCKRLDGIPLALELAAGRLEGLSFARLNDGLVGKLSLLDGANRGAEPRQQTLDATIGWSYGLLNQKERRLWGRLSVFAGGFDEDAATTVCSGPELPLDDFSETLASLVEKSIVLCDTGRDPARYRMLETIRQYGRQRLRELGEDVDAERRHRDWVLELAKAAGAHDHREAEAFDRIKLEIDNVWGALDFCRREPDGPAIGAQICRWLYPYWYSRGPLGDVRRIADGLYAQAPENSVDRAWCRFVSACMATLQGDVAAQPMADEAMAIARNHDDPELFAWASAAILLASVYGRGSSDDRFVTEAQAMIDYGQRFDRWYVESMGLGLLMRIRLSQGDIDRALEAGEPALKMCRDRNELFIRGALLNNLSEIRRRRGELEEAEMLAREGAAGQLALRCYRGLSQLVETLAWMASDRRADIRSATLLGCAHRLRDSIGLALMSVHRPRHEECERTVRARLSEATFAKAFESGAAMPEEEAMAYVLEQPFKPLMVQGQPAKPGKSSVHLTRREREIAELVAQGLSNKQIAAKLVVSERTAESHILNIANKLGLNSRTQIASWSTEQAIKS